MHQRSGVGNVSNRRSSNFATIRHQQLIPQDPFIFDHDQSVKAGSKGRRLACLPDAKEIQCAEKRRLEILALIMSRTAQEMGLHERTPIQLAVG